MTVDDVRPAAAAALAEVFDLELEELAAEAAMVRMVRTADEKLAAR